MADILCPHCSMPNPDDQNICSFCRQPLHIVADDEAIRPGDMPTKKNTSELEPILPQWLRDARTRARQGAEEEQAEQAAAEAAKPPAEEPSAPDWLAGLEAAAKDEGEEDLPDWMRGMTPSKPASSTTKREQPPQAKEPTFPRRQEISWEEEPAPTPRPVEPPPTGPLGATQSEDGIPYWLKNMEEESPDEKKEVDNFLANKEEPTQQGNVSPFESGTFRPNTGELINWLDKMSPQVGEQTPSMPSPDVPASEPLPDWVSRLDGEPAEAAPDAPTGNEFNYDWLKDESSKPFTPFQPSQMEQESTPIDESFEAAKPAELPDWMKPAEDTPQQPLSFGALESATGSSAAPQEEEKEETPDWVNTMAAAESSFAAPAQSDLPDWMKSAIETPPEETQKPSSDVPDWMKTFSAESPAVPASEPQESGLPDWIQQMPQEPASHAEETGMLDWITPAMASQPPADKSSALPSVPAFLPGEEAFSTGEASELFSTEMPDWLSGIAPTELKPAANIPQPETSMGESITPAELPSWVQAMRPVESGLPGAPTVTEPGSRPVESQGPLAGLRGVLPDMPGLATSGKPKVYSIRLEPTADQQQHAALLEKMLEDETQAKPMRGASFLLGSQRILRWVVAAILLGLISFVLFTRLHVVPMPIALSPESDLASQVMIAVPNDAPVLLVFDYEPALAGELEATAASFLNNLTTLRNPQYSVLSTSPTGAALAERFFNKSVLPERITSLGYLPGESSGILSFAMQPRGVKNVSAFSDYALVILLTDRAESARAWVEQTTNYRNGRPLVVVSSAQAAPMIQPYLISGQVNGMVSGLRDGAAFENTTGQIGAGREYWDAYNLSILVVVAMIFLGGMWNLVLGLRARRQEQADA